MTISNLVDAAQAATKKHGMQFQGDVPLSISERPAGKIGKRQVMKEWTQFFASLRLLTTKLAEDSDADDKTIRSLNTELRAMTDENRRLERVMIERGLEIVGVSAKDRQFALPAAATG